MPQSMVTVFVDTGLPVCVATSVLNGDGNFVESETSYERNDLAKAAIASLITEYSHVRVFLDQTGLFESVVVSDVCDKDTVTIDYITRWQRVPADKALILESEEWSIRVPLPEDASAMDIAQALHEHVTLANPCAKDTTES